VDLVNAEIEMTTFIITPQFCDQWTINLIERTILSIEKNVDTEKGYNIMIPKYNMSLSDTISLCNTSYFMLIEEGHTVNKFLLDDDEKDTPIIIPSNLSRLTLEGEEQYDSLYGIRFSSEVLEDVIEIINNNKDGTGIKILTPLLDLYTYRYTDHIDVGNPLEKETI
jgi:hypothetical protein